MRERERGGGDGKGGLKGKKTHPSSRFLSPLGELTAKMHWSLRALHRSQLSPSAIGRHLSFRLLHSLLHVPRQQKSPPRTS